MRRALVITLCLVAAALLWRSSAPRLGDDSPLPPRASAAASSSRATPPALGDERLRSQVQVVIEAMDRTGRPPAGVAQGGRRSGPRGVFENLEARLPPQPRGYYVESDVWPRTSHGRGAERLVFGRSGEVFFSPDHYRSFVRVR